MRHIALVNASAMCRPTQTTPVGFGFGHQPAPLTPRDSPFVQASVPSAASGLDVAPSSELGDRHGGCLTMLYKFPSTKRAYMKKPSMSFLDALHDWSQKFHARVEWVPSQTRTSNNVVEHTAIPILSYALTNAVLKREPIPPFRGLAGSPQEAEAAVKDVASLWVERQNRSQGVTPGKLTLEHPRYTVQRYQNGGKHNCWEAVLTEYVCRLDSWSVSECIGRGATVQKAKNDAAQKLLEGGVYCMFPLPDK